MIWISGHIVSGKGWAQDSLRLQFPFFRERLPEIAGFHPATINVVLEKALIPASYPTVVENVKWRDDCDKENFGFLRGQIRVGGHTHTCFLYFASNSHHRLSPWSVEVIAPFIDNLKCDANCELGIDYPYTEAACILIEAGQKFQPPH